MDAKQLSFSDGNFEAVIDKGTLDSILCGDGSGPNAHQMLSEIYRVLSPNGVYICISYGVKDQRNDYFVNKDFNWTVSHHMVAKPTISTSQVVASEKNDEKNFHWVYIMRKQEGGKQQWAPQTKKKLMNEFEWARKNMKFKYKEQKQRSISSVWRRLKW